MLLEIGYQDKTGPGEAYYNPLLPHLHRPGTEYVVPLQEGESSRDFAHEAWEAIASALGMFPDHEGTIFEEPATHPTNEERFAELQRQQVLPKYQARAIAAPRVMARWASYNEGRLLAYSPPEDPEDYDPDFHGWSPELFAGFMAKVGPVVVLLNSLAFGATAQAVQAFDDPLATAAAKHAYLDAMAAEGALPQ